MKSIQDLNVKDKMVVVRADFDVPFTPDGAIADDYRIQKALPTILGLQELGAKHIYLLAHIGQPVGRPREQIVHVQAGNPRLTMLPIAQRLREILGEPIDDLETIRIKGMDLPAYPITTGITLFENLRFDWRETKNNSEFAEELAALGDCYVYDAFAVAHREHASTVGAIKHSAEAAAGIHLLEEVSSLSKLSADIQHPYCVILGGAKIESKLPVIEQLIEHVDTFLLGGVMANTFAKSQGFDIKRSSFELEQVSLAIELYRQYPEKFILPEDYIWQNEKIMDIGLQTREKFKQTIAAAKTIFWNGTLGVTSLTIQEYTFGTNDIAQAIADNKDALTIVSGGDTVGQVNAAKIPLNEFSFVSTGGGATMEFLAGKTLPALKALGYEPNHPIQLPS
jgi:phosphoglycerate kinase